MVAVALPDPIVMVPTAVNVRGALNDNVATPENFTALVTTSSCSVTELVSTPRLFVAVPVAAALTPITRAEPDISAVQLSSSV